MLTSKCIPFLMQEIPFKLGLDAGGSAVLNNI